MKLDACYIETGNSPEICVELPRLGEKGRSLSLKFYPKSDWNPRASVALEFEMEGECYALAYGDIPKDLYADITKQTEQKEEQV